VNLYQGPDRLTTHYGQQIEDFVADKILDQLEIEGEYGRRRAEVNAFNATHRTRKRGLAITPLKFGISFTATMLNQGGALVNVFQDGSISVNHGGTEMGQGLNTKMAQVAADGLGVPMSMVRVTATDTQKVPNASATAASSGADINGAAIMNACEQLRARLAPVAASLLECAPDEVVFAGGQAQAKGRAVEFKKVALNAWLQRVGLSVAGFYRTPEIGYDNIGLQGRAFYYYCYGAGLSEVELDTLTGEWWLKRVDILQDVGRSINPALDRGQVEGAFIQGMGWLTMEECLWDGKGKLLTHGPSTYKIPVAADVPEAFNVQLFDNANIKATPNRSKATGEPPLMTALSVFFALKDAVSASANHAVPVLLDAPATPERLLLACERARAAA
jgi:xanthine dehydrogenase large subunit